MLKGGMSPQNPLLPSPIVCVMYFFPLSLPLYSVLWWSVSPTLWWCTAGTMERNWWQSLLWSMPSRLSIYLLEKYVLCARACVSLQILVAAFLGYAALILSTLITSFFNHFLCLESSSGVGRRYLEQWSPWRLYQDREGRNCQKTSCGCVPFAESQPGHLAALHRSVKFSTKKKIIRFVESLRCVLSLTSSTLPQIPPLIQVPGSLHLGMWRALLNV